MQAKKEQYLAAAIDVFSRYGIKRATMADIAENAGVSRQTLYAAYASKEEIFAAAMLKKVEHTIETVTREWGALSSASDKLDSYFQHAIIANFEQMRNMPDVIDLISEPEESPNADLTEALHKKTAMLGDLFSPFSDQLANSGMTPDELTDFVCITSANYMFSAKDTNHLKSLLRSLKLSTLSLLEVD